MRCQNCGREIVGNEQYCNGCGSPINLYQNNNPYYNNGYQPNNYQQNNYQQNNYQQNNYQPNNYQSNGYNYQPYSNPNKNDKGSNKGLIILISIIAAILILVIILIVTLSDGDSSDNQSNNNSNNSSIVSNGEDKSEYEKNMKYDLIQFDDEFYLEIQNNNKNIVDVKADISFYDKDEKLVYHDSSYILCIGNGLTSYARFKDLKEDYVDYEVTLKVDDTIYQSFMDKEFKYESNIVNDVVYVKVNNNTGVKIDNLDILVRYYKDNKVVAMDLQSDFDVKENSYAVFDFFTPFDEDYNAIDFDNYDIEVINAYSKH